MLKQVKEMPTSGQFVAVWAHEKHAWSDTYKWLDGELLICNGVEFMTPCWMDDEIKEHLESCNATFFVEVTE